MLLLVPAAVSACKSVDHSGTATQASTTPAEASTMSPAQPEAAPGNDDVFVNRVVGFSIRKPPSWRFGPTEWGAANFDRLEFKDEEFAELVLRNATEPLVVIVKYADTADALSPAFRATFRPLGELSDMSPEQIADMLVPQFRKSFAGFELLDEVAHTEVSGHQAARFASSFSVDDLTGATHLIFAETWLVKRGDYLFILEASAPGEDPSRKELRAIMESISIDPRPF
jgi:hypothetical protein